MGRPRGRPPKLSFERKIGISTRLLPSIVELIHNNSWEYHELVIDGIQHRQNCLETEARFIQLKADYESKFGKLQAVIESQAEKITILETGAVKPEITISSDLDAEGAQDG